MKDIYRVWLMWWIAALPFILISIALCIATGVTITASHLLAWEQFLPLGAAAVFAWLVFWKSDRIRHYNKVFAEHEKNYRYVKEEA